MRFAQEPNIAPKDESDYFLSKDQLKEINWISHSQIYEEKMKSGGRHKKKYKGQKISKSE